MAQRVTPVASPTPQIHSASERELDAALAHTVRAAGRTGANLESLWHAAIEADPELASAVDRRQLLANALERLAVAGVIRPLPKTRRDQDRSAHPALPLVVRTVSVPVARRPERLTLPAVLRPELAGARDLVRPRADEIATLVAVNGFLRDFNPVRPAVPARERSLEIFGDEKRLDALAQNRLFKEGILSYELLRCFEVHPPFVFARVSDAPSALVLENHHTYDSALRELRWKDRGIGVVVYGAGRAFCNSVTYLADLDPAVETAYYFGDLDGPGLTIASATHMAGLRAGTAPVVPAESLYRALLDEDRRRPAQPIDAPAAAELVAWLPEALRAQAVALLTSGHWLPQEAVGLEVLQSLAVWN
jgi:hypothetical protein